MSVTDAQLVLHVLLKTLVLVTRTEQSPFRTAALIERTKIARILKGVKSTQKLDDPEGKSTQKKIDEKVKLRYVKASYYNKHITIITILKFLLIATYCKILQYSNPGTINIKKYKYYIYIKPCPPMGENDFTKRI